MRKMSNRGYFTLAMIGFLMIGCACVAQLFNMGNGISLPLSIPGFILVLFGWENIHE